MEEHIKEIFSFASKSDRPDIQIVALENILSITGSRDGLNVICLHSELLRLLISFLKSTHYLIAKQTSLILVNVSAYEKGPEALMNSINYSNSEEGPHLVIILLECIMNTESDIADPCCMLLSNITRSKRFIEKVIDIIQKSDIRFDQIINIFTKNKYNNKGQNLYYLGPVLSNLSQSPTVRNYILDRNKCVIQKLLPFTEYKQSIIKRGGVVGTLRNCCFKTDSHKWLLSDDVDILSRLLLPLAGNTEYDDEDNEKLPPELQYLPDSKTIEEDADIRCMLLEALTQLCAVRENREYIRSKNAYVILRELHKFETDRKALLTCEDLVNILIRSEEEIGEDNLKEISIPQDLQDKFKNIDQEDL